VPVREGDGGFGVDLLRPWRRYDAAGKGEIPVAALRGLLADLGAYAETSVLVTGAPDPDAGSSASGEGAATAGAGGWRFAAAAARLDPAGTGRISFRDLKRVVTELGESIPDDELKEMIEEADRDQDGAQRRAATARARAHDITTPRSPPALS
jgi:hypothetical protein